MNKAVLKDFAIESRKDLMDKIKIKLNLFYIDEKFDSQKNGDMYILTNEKHTLNLTIDEYQKRELLLKRIREIGENRVIEEAAYTWFNRLIAIRYMEIHNFLPLGFNNESLGIRVLSSNDNTPNPEIMKYSNLINSQLDINFNQDIYSRLNNESDKFKYILQLICNKLKKVFPTVFDGITDYIDLLIPENMLNDSGFVTKILKQLTEEDFSEVEIIGWLYQYYNQTEKDRVIGASKTYSKEEIAYATQLFTPDWIVKYMVQNSVGKYWIEHNGDKELIKNWDYFIDNNIENKGYVDPKNISFIDPCSGSGHILVYAFEIFYQIYVSAGFNKKDIAEYILTYNLNGLDIDDRANQLSILSVLLKAREYDKDIFNKKCVENLNIIALAESKYINNDKYPEDLISQSEIEYLKRKFDNAKEFGSLIECTDENFEDIQSKLGDNIFDYMLLNEINPLIKQNNILAKKYDVIVTNPPYLNNSVMSNEMKNYLSKNYSVAKTDLFTCFIKRCNEWIKEDGYSSLVTMQSWMFLPSFCDFREYILDNYGIDSLVYMDNNVMGIAFGTVASVFSKNSKDKEGIYYEVKYQDLSDSKPISFPVDGNRNYKSTMSKFKKLPNYNFSYWLSEEMVQLFTEKNIADYGEAKQGLATGCNDIFMRNWFEVNYDNISFNSKNHSEALESNKKWFPYNKGGSCIKWYGNNDYIVNWENDGFEIKHFYNDKGKLRSRPQNMDYYFRESITWSLTNSVRFGVRHKEVGHIFDINGMSLFIKNEKYKNYIMAFLNTNVAFYLLKTINPTMANQSGDISKLPIIINELYFDEIESLVLENEDIMKENWNSFETSWDFAKHPLHNYSSSLISERVKEYIKQLQINYEKLKTNEERLNEIFMSIYGFNSELDKSIKDEDIAFDIPSESILVKSLLSYYVGCLFGRYSFKENGIQCTSNQIEIDKYNIIMPDEDNIIPIIDKENIYFGDAIYNKIENIIKEIYGADAFNENMDYITKQLGRKGTESFTERLIKYFVNDFYTEHVKNYQKKPIYWMLDSGKNNGFKALIYIHRYNKQLLSKVRVDYLHKTQDSYNRIKDDLTHQLSSDNITPTARQNLQKELNEIILKIDECNKYDEMLGHLANQMIDIDLDDGIKINYEKFASILTTIK